jgi:hypothetical protein
MYALYIHLIFCMWQHSFQFCPISSKNRKKLLVNAVLPVVLAVVVEMMLLIVHGVVAAFEALFKSGIYTWMLQWLILVSNFFKCDK